jgi:8-oxo-dGTP pyrophosphatase MutT (NUDIX family)
MSITAINKTFFGKNGVLEGRCGWVNTDAEIGERYRRSSFTPVTEECNVVYTADLERRLFEFAAKHYREYKEYGHEGDEIQVMAVKIGQGKYLFILNYINVLANLKPELAADLVIFVSDRNGKAFFIGIRRAYNPGQGKIAIVGGKRDMDGYRFEPAIYTARREAYEEVGLLSVLSKEDSTDSSLNNPGKEYLDITAHLGGKTYFSQIKLVGIFSTGDEEKVKSLQRKRINETTAFVVDIKMPDRIFSSAEEAASLFSAKDDAKEIVAIPLEDCFCFTEFGLAHHKRVMQAAMARLGRDVRLGF